MNVKKELIGYLKIIIIGIVIAVILNRFIIMNIDVISGSMLPTLKVDDKMIGLRTAYWFAEPERGDIIIFKFPDDECELYVKRIVGLPGDTIVIEDGKIYINGSETPLDEPYLMEPDNVYGDYGPYLIPADCYLVLGDNRNNSDDARFWENTYVTKNQIVAKVIFRYYKEIGIVK